MEKNKAYDKGRQGHSRSVYPFRVYRQKMKRWKYPVLGMGVLLALVVSVDLAGDSLKTNVLQQMEASKAGDTGIMITEENVEIVKKGFLTLLKDQMDACDALGILSCVTEARELVNKASEIKAPEDAKSFMSEVDEFIIRWSESEKTVSCELNFKDVKEAVRYGYDILSLSKDDPSKKAQTLLMETLEALGDLETKCGL